MWVNKWTCPIDRLHSITRSVVKALWQHYAALSGSRKAPVSVHRYSVHLKITLTLIVAYLTTWSLCFPVKGFQRFSNTKADPFLGFAQAFSVLIVWKGLLLKHSYLYCRLNNYVYGQPSAYPQLNPLYLISMSLKLFQALCSFFPYWKQQEAGQDLGRGY